MYNEVTGNLITLAKQGNFDVIAHGCNCFCTMGAGLAPQMARAFGCDNYAMEAEMYVGDVNKLGTIDYQERYIDQNTETVYYSKVDLPPDAIPTTLSIVNCYSQFGFGTNHKEGSVAPIDYEALALCLRKMNHQFAGKHIGLPRIGCHLAGGDWNIVKAMIQKEFTDCDVTVVEWDGK